MSGKDALLQLRASASKGQLPVWSSDKQTLQIGSVTYPRTLLTPYRLQDKSAFYSLDAFVVLLEEAAKDRQFNLHHYLQRCTALGVAKIQTAQRKEVLEYLRGEVDSTPSIDVRGYEAQSVSGFTQQQGRSAAADEGMEDERKEVEEEERAGKRQRLDNLNTNNTAAQIKPVHEWNIEDITREEYPIATHLSVLQVQKRNLTSLLDFYNRAVSSSSSSSSGVKTESSSSSSRDHHHHKSSSSKVKHESSSSSRAAPATLNPSNPNYGVPIIVVPAAVSSVINMYNVRELLENGVFVSGEKIRAENPTLKKLNMYTISRSGFFDPSKTVKYQVIDDVSQLKGDEDWNRVVAVFVNGAAWQFADWPKSKWANPAAIFENVCAFHLHFDDEALHANISAWRTHRLPISKSKRHGDRGVVLDFWHTLTEFISRNNSVKKLVI